MADKQMSSMVVTTEADLDRIQSILQDLKTNYSDTQLKKLLAEHGLEKMPLTVNTRNVLLKKLAQKMLNIESTSNLPDSVTSKSAVNSLGNTKVSKEDRECDETSDICKTLIEARQSLSSCLSDSNKSYYVICIPGSSNTITVHSDFRDVLKLMKEHKNQNPRMLSFSSLTDAEAFAKKNTANEVCLGTTIKTSYPKEKAEVELAELKLFPSLLTPQLNEFRILLERGNTSVALERILANPRYLVLSIDMPTILKEGPRYNALHASVMAGQLESCKLVMEMISDVEYLKRLYETRKRAEENSKRLIDLYLNTPDKVANKTPLHIASERGFVEIVAFLVSFKACIRNFNHHIHETVKRGTEQIEQVLVTGDTPEEMACSRYKGPNAASVKAKIVDLIKGGTCYVPLIRSDTTGPYAKVGEPYTPTSPYKLVSEIEDVFKPTASNQDLGTKDFRNMKVWAFAGPMSPKEAEDFRKEWKSPRMTRHSQIVRENLKIMDGDRGFERFGRELAESHSTSWQEYWPFLDAFADLRSEEGLEKLNLFFQKQKVINLMQALMRKEEFVATQPYHVNQEYILVQDMSDSEESEEENEVYHSAESPSCSEEDGLDGPEMSTLDTEKSEDSLSVSSSKSSGGFFSSIWGGLVRLKNFFSPNFGRNKQNTSNATTTSVTGSDSSKISPNRRVSPRKSRSQPSSNNDQVDSVSDLNTTATSVIAPKRSIPHQNDGANSFLPPSKVRKYADKKGKNINKEHSSVAEMGHSNNVGTESANLDVPRTPDKWKYRTHIGSPESDSCSPEKTFHNNLSSSSFDMDVDSPADAAGAVLKKTSSLPLRSDQMVSSSQTYSSEPELDISFNTKMDTFSRNLEKFSILSPGTPSTSITTTPSPSSSHLDSDMEPCVHIFTGKLFSKFLSELKFRKLTDIRRVKYEDKNLLPALFLRQADDTVFADCFLPGIQGTDSLLQARGHILDESTHKEAVKNVWNNFLVVFSTPGDAKRISSLSHDEIVTAVIEGMPEDKDFCSISSYSRVDQGSLKELYLKSKESLFDSKHSVTLFVRIIRSSTLPIRDVFVCGTIPTKVDADVYNTLNSKACQVIRKEPQRFSNVSQWYDNMTKQGKDSINRLPSPSRVLRSGRELPPASPLVGTPLRQQPGISSPMTVTMAGGKPNDSIVRNLFGPGYKNGAN